MRSLQSSGVTSGVSAAATRKLSWVIVRHGGHLEGARGMNAAVLTL